MVLPSTMQSSMGNQSAGKVPMRLKGFVFAIVVLASVVLLSIGKDKEDPVLRFDDEVARRVEAAQAAEGRFLVEGLDNLRIAAFGTGATWGAGLASRDLAYPHLISAHTDNYAMLSGGPNYPAVCAHTLIGNEKKYDLILLEYYLDATQGLEELAGKLRRRFPNAFMITVKIDGPNHARRRDPDTKDVVKFQDWVKARGLENSKAQEVLDALDADNGEWFFPNRKNANKYIKDNIHDKYHAFRVRLPRRDNDKETLALYLQWYNHNGFNDLKPIGQEMIADMIRGTIETKLHFGSVDGLIAKAEKLGSWGRGDSCQFWPTPESYTGELTDSIHLKKLNRFNDKLVMEVHGPGSFTVTNPFFNQRNVFISYLTNTNTYKPATLKVKVGEFGIEHKLDPSATKPNHPIRTVPMGLMPAGKDIIHIDIDGEPSADPPRIIGVTLSDEVATPHEFSFYPHFE